MKIKIADTVRIKRINATEGNRRITAEGISRLDPDGLHVLEPVMEHGREVRCYVHLKARGTHVPMSLFLDVPTAEYERLPDAPEVR